MITNINEFKKYLITEENSGITDSVIDIVTNIINTKKIDLDTFFNELKTIKNNDYYYESEFTVYKNDDDNAEFCIEINDDDGTDEFIQCISHYSIDNYNPTDDYAGNGRDPDDAHYSPATYDFNYVKTVIQLKNFKTKAKTILFDQKIDNKEYVDILATFITERDMDKLVEYYDEYYLND